MHRILIKTGVIANMEGIGKWKGFPKGLCMGGITLVWFPSQDWFNFIKISLIIAIFY